MGSFLWKSLLWGRDLVEKGSRWRVGNGSSIRIYKDRWIPWESTFMVMSPAALNLNATVDCLKVESEEWNEVLIRESFMDVDVEGIISLPPRNGGVVDRLLWHYHNSGDYSVRSGYWIASSSDDNPSCSGLSDSKSWWKFFWHLKLPQKIKLFVWKACNNWIPTWCNLVTHGMCMEVVCLVCAEKAETTLHALWRCPSLKGVR